MRRKSANNSKPTHGARSPKRVKVTVELPASVHRDLVAYAEILAAQSGQSISEPNKLIPLMLARFMSTDRAFVRSRKLRKEANG
jgi:hypothetical protein